MTFLVCKNTKIDIFFWNVRLFFRILFELNRYSYGFLQIFYVPKEHLCSLDKLDVLPDDRKRKNLGVLSYAKFRVILPISSLNDICPLS
jgi:hypothetical protein